jgi:hypothetical protein
MVYSALLAPPVSVDSFLLLRNEMILIRPSTGESTKVVNKYLIFYAEGWPVNALTWCLGKPPFVKA